MAHYQPIIVGPIFGHCFRPPPSSFSTITSQLYPPFDYHYSIELSFRFYCVLRTLYYCPGKAYIQPFFVAIQAGTDLRGMAGAMAPLQFQKNNKKILGKKKFIKEKNKI
jgi:hypothetical protein